MSKTRFKTTRKPLKNEKLWSNCLTFIRFFLRCFRNPIRVPRISENYHRVPRIREIGSLHVHTGYLPFSLKKTCTFCPNVFKQKLVRKKWNGIRKRRSWTMSSNLTWVIHVAGNVMANRILFTTENHAQFRRHWVCSLVGINRNQRKSFSKVRATAESKCYAMAVNMSVQLRRTRWPSGVSLRILII